MVVLDGLQGGDMQELALLAPHHRQVHSGQRRMHGEIGALINIVLRQPHLQSIDIVRRQRYQFDIGGQLLA